jgi:hypothetical protein
LVGEGFRVRVWMQLGEERERWQGKGSGVSMREGARKQATPRLERDETVKENKNRHKEYK